MASKPMTRLEPAPLAFPNGGGLQAMATAKNSVHAQKLRVMEERHKLEKLQLQEETRKKNQQAVQARKKSSNGR